MTICIDLVPTEICQWKCQYCIFPSIKDPKQTSEDIIDKHFSYIKKHIDTLKLNKIDVQLYLQGGEVGELPKSVIQYLLEKIDSEITISTNGLFMEKEYHKDPIIRKYIKQIFWHVSPDCETTHINNFKDSDIKIIRGIVNQDITKLNRFLLLTNMDIEYSEIENDLDKKSIISEEIINKCRNYHNDITIDLVNENLCLCIRNFKSIIIPLNEENLIRILKSFPKDVYNIPSTKESSCYSCCRLCTTRVNNKMIENKIKLIRIYS